MKEQILSGKNIFMSLIIISRSSSSYSQAWRFFLYEIQFFNICSFFFRLLSSQTNQRKKREKKIIRRLSEKRRSMTSLIYTN